MGGDPLAREAHLMAGRPVAPRIGRALLLAFFSALFVLYVAGPVAWLVSSSLQTEAQITAIPPNWLPPEINLGNFDAILNAAERQVTYETRRQGDPASGGFLPSGAANLIPSLWNSLTVGLWVAALNLLLSVTAAYAIADLSHLPVADGCFDLIFFHSGDVNT
jgi:multiple sugar transport system permease protein